MLISLLVLLALVTYRPGDPSLDTASDAVPHNFLGTSGATLADALLQAIGLAAYLIPLVLIGWALMRLVSRAGFQIFDLPLAMVAAAFVAALLMAIMGLSWGDWRDIGGGAGRGATRLARASASGTWAAAALGGRAVR